VHLSFLNPLLWVESKHRKQMPSDGVACLDNGMYKIWFARCYKVHCCSILCFSLLPTAMLNSSSFWVHCNFPPSPCTR
jgi:hypothetical protein